jgi:hypothetical protein
MFASDEFVGEGTVVDLGVPGCAVESPVAPSPGDYVCLHILMPGENGSSKVCVAKVRWALQQRFGVEFMTVPDDHQLRLGRLLSTHVDAL